MLRISSILFVASISGCTLAPPTVSSETVCETVIVGGGAAGLYLAYRLGPRFHNQVCLFEKEDKLGGRMRDETLSGGDDGIWIGTGARRVDTGQKVVMDLAKELGVNLQSVDKRTQLIRHRGRFSYSTETFVKDYPRLLGPFDSDPNTTREWEIFEVMFKKEHYENVSLFPALKSYLTAIGGTEGVPFLKGISRFHGEFDYDISTPNFLEYLEREIKLNFVEVYPEGGMSAFIRKMEAAAIVSGVRIFKGEPILKIAMEKASYKLNSSFRNIQANRVVIAVPPTGFEHIDGELAQQIRKSPEYKALLPIRVVVINQWWNKRWWDSVRNPAEKGDTAKTWRAWTSDHCINQTEIPQEKYAAPAKATRSVYSDDIQCVKYWEELLAREGIPGVEAKVAEGLSVLFNHGLTKVRVKIPKPLKTTMHVWPGAWYYVRAGSQISNEQIAQWALSPLPDKPNLMLVGESYFPNRSGWSEGAYSSVDALLEAKFKRALVEH